VLLREDVESDFFVNVTHIQLHRRMRAMGRLKRALLPTGGEDEPEGDQERPSSVELSQGSLSQVLVPLCWSPILSEEYDKKEQQSYLLECVALLGAVCRRLAWSHYHRTIRAVLSRLEKVSVDHERILLSTLVAVVEGFPLDLTHSEDEAQRQEDAEGAQLANEDEEKEEDDGEQEEVGEGEDADVEAARRVAATSVGQQHSNTQLVQVITRSLVPWIRKFLLKDSTNK
jgi:U3 small nucleolar RNA-associated protein 20